MGMLAWTTPAFAAEFFGEFLYWKATETVDWVLNTNRDPLQQYIDYGSTEFGFSPGFRIGVQQSGEWDVRASWTRFSTSTTASESGDLTAAFLGGKNSQPPAPQLYFDTGQLEASIDYNMIDLDLGKAFQLGESLRIRPLVGLRGGMIEQSFTTAFQAEYDSGGSTSQRNIVETATNDFWGIGPKIGIENQYTLRKTEHLELNVTANFYMAYLLGDWQVHDVTAVTQIDGGMTSTSSQVIQTSPRDFGSLTFQTIVGVQLKYGHLTATAGYELNDWLNQCQIFTDASGPQNNDLLLQGLTVRLAYNF
ncbi:MAG: hypothetical protein C0478_17770 [Planctomyces sp.]|nr:hypothetical protein [Planctomyces sp.]